ncbi:GTPase-activating protein [Saccharomycopsis crataegensis]|uniref:GTPase-activating protein n=1 Tax=Saccharomycopsis crataegensis TaxID=43959 RepID=A0AAV5QRY0_9ASCO|nr:GTPase-activating protein [Saccharomycopsis crataegensis]
MSRFSNSFWSHDYSTGVNTLFDRLHDGCLENQNYINLFVARHQSELAFGNSLNTFPDKFTSNFNKNTMLINSTKNSFIGINTEIGKEGQYHLEIAKNIDQHIILPFTSWAMKHKERVEYSENELKTKIKAYERLYSNIDRTRIKYFNKVRSAEDFKEKLDDKITQTIKRANTFPPEEVSDPGAGATKLARSNTTVAEDMKSLTLERNGVSVGTIKEESEAPEEEEQIVTLGGYEYSKSQLKDVLASLLNTTPKFSHRVPIFGTYDRVSTGSAITEAIQKCLGISKLEKIEEFGQDLINGGYLRLIGTVGSQFANSSKLNYQWKPEAYKAADIVVEGVDNLTRASSMYNPVNDINPGARFSEVFEDVKGMITTLEPNEENYRKILKDVRRFEKEYYELSKQLDVVRTELEESIEEHHNFMQRCEMDRLKALKKVTFDFLSILSNRFSSLKSVVDKAMLLQDNMNPEQDLETMIESNKTGSFIPHPKVFEDYFDSQDTQVFGISLQSRCRFDHKSVPLVISSILMHLDSVYPDMGSDEERISVWLNDVPLVKTHELRSLLNDPKAEITEQLLSKYHPSVLSSVLQLYLLELPNSLVPNEKYYLFKSLYEQYGAEDAAQERIVGIENLLVDLPRPNIATLNYLCAHLSNFISTIALNDGEVTNGEDSKPKLTVSENFKIQVCKKFTTAILREKVQTTSQLTDKHPYRLLFDLLTHKDQVFKELKKRNTVKKTSVSRNASKKTLIAGQKDTALKNVEPEPLRLSVDSKAKPIAEVTMAESGKQANDEEPDTVIQF